MLAFTGSPLVAGQNLGKQHTGTGKEAFAARDARVQPGTWETHRPNSPLHSPIILPRTPLLGSAPSGVLGGVPSVAGVLGGHSSIPFFPLASVHPSVNGVVRKPCRTRCTLGCGLCSRPCVGRISSQQQPRFCRRDWEGMWLCSFLAVLQDAFVPNSHTSMSDTNTTE